MPAARYVLRVEQGSFFGKYMNYRDKDGAPKNLTGYTGRLQIRRFEEDPLVMFELTTENGCITLGGPAGTIALEMTGEQTARLTSDGVYDLELIDPSGEPHRLLYGPMELSREVTR